MKFISLFLSAQLIASSAFFSFANASSISIAEATQFLRNQLTQGYVFEAKVGSKSEIIQSVDNLPKIATAQGLEIRISHPKQFSKGVELGFSVSSAGSQNKVSLVAYQHGKYVTGRNVLTNSTSTSKSQYAADQSELMLAFQSIEQELKSEHGLELSLHSSQGWSKRIASLFIPEARADLKTGCMLFGMGAMFALMMLGGSKREKSTGRVSGAGAAIMMLGLFGGLGLMMSCD